MRGDREMLCLLVLETPTASGEEPVDVAFPSSGVFIAVVHVVVAAVDDGDREEKEVM